ncbi:hypothetical protein [Pseudonocardia cypriaca]|uniref:hypothetical protein n=1 Tax=Pseudonocardia cypriaca TaxID=882449 RepID=UPI00114EDB76|nr:hypothetical protein [Pseudonocardia cypriaca]
MIRRDPLAARTVLTPAVLDDLDGDDTSPRSRNGATAPLPDRSTLQPNAPADFPTVQATRNGTSTNGSGPRNTGKTPATTPAGSASDSEPSVTGFGGVDVSDYV